MIACNYTVSEAVSSVVTRPDVRSAEPRGDDDVTPRPISDAELEVLKVLWDAGPASVRAVQDTLVGWGRDLAYTTVQTLLQRLVEKGYVTVDRSATTHVFEASVSRDGLVSHQLDEMADRICDGEMTPLVLNLVQRRDLSAGEIRRLRTLLDELEAESARGGRETGRRRTRKKSR